MYTFWGERKNRWGQNKTLLFKNNLDISNLVGYSGNLVTEMDGVGGTEVGGRFNVGRMGNYYSFKEVKVMFLRFKGHLRSGPVPTAPSGARGPTYLTLPPTPGGCLPELGAGAPWLVRGPALGGLRLGGVPLTCGSKHHHHLLVRHASGSGKCGPEKPGGRGKRGVGNGARGPRPEPRACTGGGVSHERSGSAAPGLTPGPDTPSPARVSDPCPDLRSLLTTAWVGKTTDKGGLGFLQPSPPRRGGM